MVHTILYWPTEYLWGYTTLSYWPTVYLYGTLLSSTGPLDISGVHYPPLLEEWLSLWYTILLYVTLAIYMVQYYLLLAQMAISMVHYPHLLAHYYPYDALVSSTHPLNIYVIHFPLLLVHRLSLWNTTIFY